jgi:hypothetical protein
MAFKFSGSFMAHPGAALLATALLAGCATMASTPEEVVKKRAAQQWTARLANDFDTTYTFAPPSFRALTSLESYKKGFGKDVKIESAEVAEVKCESEDKCVAQVKVKAQPILLLNRRAVPHLVTYIDETWIREDGQWWLFPTP